MNNNLKGESFVELTIGQGMVIILRSIKPGGINHKDDPFLITKIEGILEARNFTTIMFTDTLLLKVKLNLGKLIKNVTEIKNGKYLIRLNDFSVIIYKDECELLAGEIYRNKWCVGFLQNLSDRMPLLIDNDGDMVFRTSRGLFLADFNDLDKQNILKALLALQYLQKNNYLIE
jgi:hypothetical protein